ncbi:hypothetical protein EV421DRAFT_1718841 [Armillaria borealis]|uniref:Uncharacterized protein n=1 Tax=Armillaria borealis TaxID=47425 RepID=A0AA39J0E1_9AGAR|nr:hypothetical protein EV421DRAFT_1718841 [Armillaria borealis]
MSDALLLQAEIWKPWYKQIRKTVDSIELPGQWNLVTMYLTLLEGRNGFKKGDGGKADILLPTHRPQWLSHWIHCGRKALPHHELKDLTTMSEEWWKFWKSLQPEWRNIDGVKGPLGPSHHEEIVRDKEWGELAKRGVNGIVTMVAGLAFWGYVAKGGMRRQKDIWENAVEDMKWVLQCMSSK